jgi:hypothetical protein
MSFDVALIETGNGGDVVLKGSDLAVVYGIQNMLYLAWFGGNLEGDTERSIRDAQSVDYWGNRLFSKDEPSAWFNSLTERTLNTTPLTSSGRVIIENAMKKDLEFMRAFGVDISLTVEIVSTDRIRTVIKAIVDRNERVIEIDFKKAATGDFWIPDFNNDFFV